MATSSNTSNVPQTAAHRVFATPELLKKIMSNLQMIEMFTLQRVNRTFSDIFTIAPSLLRTNGVRTSLRIAAPPDHVEEFSPFVAGLKSKKLLIRPFEFKGVGTDKESGLRMLKFSLDTDMVQHAKDCGTIMGYAGLSGQDYAAGESWGDIAIATTKFCVSVDIRFQNRSWGNTGGSYGASTSLGPSVTKMRDLFELLEGVRDMKMAEHEWRFMAVSMKKGKNVTG